ncbi:hemin uptake protein HemP [Stieleria neptunia]|uniref:hemin uptake protein HemP n=1 Tax=Stieleria neptunia TaxID=2527979 RepID=UPI0011A3FC61
MQQSNDQPDDRKADPSAPDCPTPSPEASPLIIASHDLFRGRVEIWIEHGELMYRLRRTSAGKLYLCK